MTQKPEDGGPAFPSTCLVEQIDYQTMTTRKISEGGMTLRQYYAAAALQGLMAKFGPNVGCDEAAEDCFKLADALIRAEKEKAWQP